MSKPGCLYPSPANVAHTVFDAVVDEYLPIMNRLSAMVGGIKDRVGERENELVAVYSCALEWTMQRASLPL